jgi:hypothetical protein
VGSKPRTGEPCEDKHVKRTLGLTSDDAIVGFFDVGTPRRAKEPRMVDLDDLVSEYVA